MTTEEAVRHIPPPRHFIAGQYADRKTSATIEVRNPATGERIASVPDTSAEDVDRAVAAARSSFDNASWRGEDPSEKERILLRVADLMAQHREELAGLESLENGKPFREAVRGDINPGIDSFRYYAGWARRIYGETIPVDGHFLNYTLREPVGVVGAMTALKLAELCAEAGVPEGVLNVITGYGATAGEAYALEQYTNVKSVWVAL